MCKTKDLPQNPETLIEMIHHRDDEIDLLREQIRFFKTKLYGRSSEKGIPLIGQESLFEEEEVQADKPGGKPKEVDVPAHKRKKRNRMLPDHLDRRVEVVDVPLQERTCCGREMKKMGDDVTKKLEYKKADVYVREIVRPKYACPVCEGTETKGKTVKQAPLPAQLIAKSFATPSLLTQIITARFVDSMPYYRQAKQFGRLDIKLDRSLIGSWVIKVAEKCIPLHQLLMQLAKQGDQLGIDETTFQVLNEPGRSNKTKSHMWVIRGGPPNSPVVVFHYHPNRSKTVAQQLLSDYKGYVQSDAYAAYDYLEKSPDVHHLGCWAHVRRRFVDVIKARQSKRMKRKGAHADTVVGLIKELYAVESMATDQNVSDKKRQELRRDNSQPILDAIRKILDNLDGRVPPKSLLGNAVSYALKHWVKLVRYMEQPFLRPDNNLVENAIRPFVLGRKNSLFAGNPAGAKCCAIFYSLIETARANGWNPEKYISHLLNGLVNATTVEDYIQLLPTNPTPTCS